MSKIKNILLLVVVIGLLAISSCMEDNNMNNDNETKEKIAVGIWHRPNVLGTETNLEGIKNTLDSFQKCGINIVYLETVYHGMAIYKSNYLPYYTSLSKYQYDGYRDYLAAFVSEAKKRNIEVHAWVEDFYIGISESTITKNHKEWLLLTDTGSSRQYEGNGYIFLDPANSEVTSFLINVYKELLENNQDLAGLNLDYIRYPVSSLDKDTGYTDIAKEEFLKELNIEQTNEINFKDIVKANYNKWISYRANKITTFVKDVRTMVKTINSKIILSTAVFPNQNESYITKKQDFTTWLENKYLDVVTPMAYYDDINSLENNLRAMVDSSNGIYCYTGLSCIYHHLSEKQIYEQIDLSLKLSDGIVIFGSQMLLENQDYIDSLNKYFKDKKYCLPHLEVK